MTDSAGRAAAWEPRPAPSEGVPPALEARSLSKRYRRGPLALDSISLAIEVGRVVALVGPNGAGKTTLLHCWMGFRRPSHGSVRVLGIDPAAEHGRAGRNVAFVPQEISVIGELTPREHVRWAAYLRPGFDEDTALEYIAAQGIDVPRRAAQLSGGERTQLALALALGCRAPVVLLDEPFSHLDPVARVRSADVLFQGLRRDRATAVISSHLVSDLERYCDWIVLLGAGRCLLTGPITELLAAHRVTVDTIADGSRHLEIVSADRTLRLTVPSGATSVPSVPRRPSLEELVLAYLSLPVDSGAQQA